MATEPEPEPEWIVRALADAAARERAPQRLRLALAAPPRRRLWPRSAPAPRHSGRPRRALAATIAGVAVVAILGLLLSAPGRPAGAVRRLAAAVTGGSVRLRGVRPVGATVYAGLGPVHFPRRLRTSEWRLTRAVQARFAGRPVLELTYRWHGHSLTYVVAGAPVLPGQPPPDSTFVAAGQEAVTWTSGRHTCLLLSASVPSRVLVAIARS